MKTVVHTSEIIGTRNKLKKIIEVLFPDPSTYEATYIPGEKIIEVIEALDGAAGELMNAADCWSSNLDDVIIEHHTPGIPDGDPLGDIAEHTID